MIKTLIGKKLLMTARFNQAGKRLPVTVLEVGPCAVVQTKTLKTDGYRAILLGFGERKVNRTNKPLAGLIKKAGLKQGPRFLCEVSAGDEELPEIGSVFGVGQVFQPGDTVKVAGISKGRGFAGVVKRWGFAGGPKTHGQSDRWRAPGSIGQHTDPGRVWPGKKMAGRMGGQTVTVKNLVVQSILPDENLLLVKGSVPGSQKGLVLVSKVGQNKKFSPLIEDKKPEKSSEKN